MIEQLVVDALAAYRLTRLVTEDTLTEPARLAFVEGAFERAGRELPEAQHGATTSERVALDDDPPKLATLLTCRWCAGVWVAAGVVLARRVAPRPWNVIAEGLAIASAAALVAAVEDD